MSNIIEKDYTELKSVYTPCNSVVDEYSLTIESMCVFNEFMVKPKFRIPRKIKKPMSPENRLFTIIRLDTKWELENFLKH